jgi:hypothetical protein
MPVPTPQVEELVSEHNILLLPSSVYDYSGNVCVRHCFTDGLPWRTLRF